jgi:3-hydroxyisobutyrate dehydrogenase-like beta-hydroxyacid dehydrogenase
MTFSKVLIIGLGQLGLAAAKYVKERGFDTYGYDINTDAMKIAHGSAGIKQITDFGSHDFDVYIICVSTHKPDDIFSPQIDGILSIADKISREAKKEGALEPIRKVLLLCK